MEVQVKGYKNMKHSKKNIGYRKWIKDYVSVDSVGPTHRTRFFSRERSTFLNFQSKILKNLLPLCLYLASNVRLRALEREDEPTGVLFGAIVFDSEYQKCQIKRREQLKRPFIKQEQIMSSMFWLLNNTREAFSKGFVFI